jgi:hypothetical protein
MTCIHMAHILILNPFIFVAGFLIKQTHLLSTSHVQIIYFNKFNRTLIKTIF